MAINITTLCILCIFLFHIYTFRLSLEYMVKINLHDDMVIIQTVSTDRLKRKNTRKIMQCQIITMLFNIIFTSVSSLPST
jgi:hypothetical protein